MQEFSVYKDPTHQNAFLSTAAIKQGICGPMLLSRISPACSMGQHLLGGQGVQRLTLGRKQGSQV